MSFREALRKFPLVCMADQRKVPLHKFYRLAYVLSVLHHLYIFYRIHSDGKTSFLANHFLYSQNASLYLSRLFSHLSIWMLAQMAADQMNIVFVRSPPI